MEKSKTNTKKLLTSILWLVVGIATVALLISAVYNKESKHCKGVDITISGVTNNFFIDKNDVYTIIKNNGGDSTQHIALSSINLKLIEKELEKDVWVKNAELFFDNNNILKVTVEEREPVARIFSNTGSTFYIDSNCKVLPLSEKFSARLPIFTGLNNNVESLSHADSLLLNDIKNIAVKINADTFLTAMIVQIDIVSKNSFEFIPNIGKQKILFGNGDDVDSKFTKLKLFYKNVVAQSGWNKYSTINLQYKNQVVASLRGVADVLSDSLQTMQMMQMIVDDATLRSSDSSLVFVKENDKNNTDSSMIELSVEREDEGVEPSVAAVAAVAAAVVKKPTITKPVVTVKPTTAQPTLIPVKPPIKKPVAIAVAKPATAVATKPKPVVVMPPKPKAKVVTTKPIIKPVLKKKPPPKPTNEF
jgi:cell division protein FtsQ